MSVTRRRLILEMARALQEGKLREVHEGQKMEQSGGECGNGSDGAEVGW